MRKGKGAIGLYGPEKVGPTLVGATSKDDSAAGSRAAQRGDLNQWRKRKEGEKKVTYVYKTVDEVKSEGVYRKAPAPQSKLSKVKVIDMTGPEQRVLSGYHELHHQPTRPIEEREDETAAKRGPVGSNFSVSELIHNLDLLVDMTEQRIMRNDREAKYEEDRTVNLQHELERLDDLTRAEEAQAHRLAKVSDILSQLEERTKEGCSDFLTLSEIARDRKSVV